MALEDFDELLPNEDPLTPDDALAASEAIALDDGGLVEVEDAPTPIGRSIAWDHENRQAVMSGHAPLTVRGDQSVSVWIEKAIRTAEGAHTACPAGYGMQRPVEDYLSELPLDETALIEDLQRCVLFHPAITSVDVTLDIEPDDDNATDLVMVEMVATLDDDSEVTVGTDLVATGEAF